MSTLPSIYKKKNCYRSLDRQLFFLMLYFFRVFCTPKNDLSHPSIFFQKRQTMSKTSILGKFPGKNKKQDPHSYLHTSIPPYTLPLRPYITPCPYNLFLHVWRDIKRACWEMNLNLRFLRRRLRRGIRRPWWRNLYG